MGQTAQTLRVTVVGDVSGYTAALEGAASATQKFGSGAVAAGRSLTRHLTLPIVAVAAASVKLASDYEETMQQVVGLTGTSQKTMESWSKTILTMAPKVGKAPQELAEALYFVASAGVKGAAALQVVKVSAKASAGGLGETKTVADAVTSAMNAYGQKNMTAAHAADVLTATVREGKGEASSFAPVIGNVAAIAAQLGVKFEDVGGALASMTRLGTDSATAATQLQAVFSSLLKVTPAQAKALGDVGLSAGGLRSELKDKGLLPTLDTLKTAFHGNTAEMVKAFPNVRALRGVLALVGTQATDTAGVFKRMSDSTGATNTAFTSSTGTMAFKWKQASAQMQAAGIQVGTALAPTMITLAGYVQNLAQRFQDLSPHAQRMIGFAAAITAAAGPLIGLMGRLAGAISGVGRALGAIAFGGPLASGLALLGSIAAIVAGHFIANKIAADNLKASFEGVKTAADGLDGSLATLSDANIRVATAKANVVSTSHQVQAALIAEKQASDGTTKQTLAEKLAHDQTVQAKLSHKAAIQELNNSLTAQNKAQTTANQTMKDSLSPVLSFAENLNKATGWSGLLGGKLPGVSTALGKLTGNWIGFNQNVKASEPQVRMWGIATEKAGQQIFTTAVNTQKMSPAGRAAHEAIGLMTEAAGRFAREAGHTPTSIKQITDEAAKLHPDQFEGVMKAWIKSANKAGVEIPGWVKTAATDAGKEANTMATNIKTPLATLPAAGHAAGAQLSSGLASGIDGSAAIAKAYSVVNQIKAVLNTKWESPPDAFGHKVGSKLIAGIAEGIIASEGKATTAAEQTKQKIKATFQATQIVADMKAAGQVIGVGFANSIIGGLVERQPSLVQQANGLKAAIVASGPAIQEAGKVLGLSTAQAIAAGVLGYQEPMKAQIKKALVEATTAAIAASKQAVVDAKAAFSTAFGDLANAALAAFDKKMADWKPPSGTLLDAYKLQDQINQMTEGLGPAVTTAQSRLAAAFSSGNKQAIDQAQNDLDAALTNSYNAIDFNTTNMLNAAQATLAQAQAEGDPDKVAAAQAAYDQALTDRTAALNQNQIDQRALIEQNLQYRADAEQRTHDAIAAKQREGLAKQLVQLQTWLLKHPAEWAKMAGKVQTVLGTYNVKLQDAGHAWADKFASGVTAGIPAAVKAAHALAAAVAAVLPSKNSPLQPAKRGPLAFHPYDMGKDWATALGSGLTAGRLPTTMAGMAAAPGGLAFAGGSGGGAAVVNVYVSGTVVSENQLVDAVYRGLVRKSGRNSGNLGLT